MNQLERMITIFILENAFENVVCEIASIWSRPQWVKSPTNSSHWTSPVNPCLLCTRRLLVVGHPSRRPARCLRLALVHRHRIWSIPQWRYCIFIDESKCKFQHTDGRARVHRGQSQRHIGVRVLRTDGNIGPSVIVWAGFHHIGKSELIVLDGTTNQQMYRSRLPWA